MPKGVTGPSQSSSTSSSRSSSPEPSSSIPIRTVSSSGVQPSAAAPLNANTDETKSQLAFAAFKSAVAAYKSAPSHQDKLQAYSELNASFTQAKEAAPAKSSELAKIKAEMFRLSRTEAKRAQEEIKGRLTSHEDQSAAAKTLESLTANTAPTSEPPKTPEAAVEAEDVYLSAAEELESELSSDDELYLTAEENISGSEADLFDIEEQTSRARLTAFEETATQLQEMLVDFLSAQGFQAKKGIFDQVQGFYNQFISDYSPATTEAESALMSRIKKTVLDLTLEQGKVARAAIEQRLQPRAQSASQQRLLEGPTLQQIFNYSKEQLAAMSNKEAFSLVKNLHQYFLVAQNRQEAARIYKHAHSAFQAHYLPSTTTPTQRIDRFYFEGLALLRQMKTQIENAS